MIIEIASHIILYGDIISHQLPEPTLFRPLVLSHLSRSHEAHDRLHVLSLI
jgi:hypothetical protein